MPDQVPKAVVQERYVRLTALVEEIAWAENQRWEGRAVDVLVAEGEGRKDEACRMGWDLCWGWMGFALGVGWKV